MKRIFSIFILLLILASCSRHEISRKFRWKSIDALSDSIMLHLESGYAEGLQDSVLMSLSDSLSGLAARPEASPQLKGRAHFWRARLLNKVHRSREALIQTDSALSLSDSSRYPYDHARFRHLRTILNSSSAAAAHHTLKQIEAFHNSRRDPVMQAHVYLDLGNILSDIGDTKRALQYYMAADSIYDTIGMKEFHVKTSLNNASILHALGEDSIAGEVMTRLLADSIAKADKDFYNTVKYIGSHILRRPELLVEAYHEAKGNPSYAGRIPNYASYMAYDYMADGEMDSALQYIEIFLDKMEVMQDSSQMRDCIRNAILVYEATGYPDTVAMLTKKYIALENAEKRAKRVNVIYAEENRSDIEKYEELMRSRRASERLVLWIIILAVAVVALAIWTLYVRRRDLHKIEMARAQVEVEKERRHLFATSLAMTEKDNVLQAVLNDVERLQARGHIPAVESRQIENTIRLHFSNKADHENISMLFEKVHPSFAKVLKDRYPKLSEGDVKLAIYMKAGMSTKQISKMLLLQPDSVKKNRHRLRERLGLSPGDSLEDLLRNIE